jgi:exopolyphosphatase/guanosine-5'-triphosphate,3'-diphosphate pyrophosphatase
MDDLMSKTIEQRRGMKGLPAQRADVILTGAALLHEAMSYLGYATTLISDRGVKWGLFYEKFC